MISGRAVVVLIKVALLIIGLWMLLSPEPSAPNAAHHRGQVYAKAIGALLLVLAAIPYRAPRGGHDQQETPEDL